MPTAIEEREKQATREGLLAQQVRVCSFAATYRPSDLLKMKVPGVTPALAGEPVTVEAIQERRRLIMANIRYRRTNPLAASNTLPMHFAALLGAMRSETMDLETARTLDRIDASMKSANENALSPLQQAAE